MNHRIFAGMVSVAVVLGSALPLWADVSVRFTGTIEMAVDHLDPGAFGLTFTEVPVGSPLLPPFEADFSVTFIGGGTPDPSDLPAVLEDFDLTIGNTSWDETMPYTDMRVLVQGDTVLGIQAYITVTRPDHPDLAFFLPSSPGIWEAHDLVNGTDRGYISGTYSVEGTAALIPEPCSLSLAGIGLLATLIGSRRSRALKRTRATLQ